MLALPLDAASALYDAVRAGRKKPVPGGSRAHNLPILSLLKRRSGHVARDQQDEPRALRVPALGRVLCNAVRKLMEAAKQQEAARRAYRAQSGANQAS
jgi:hypothetical protein